MQLFLSHSMSFAYAGSTFLKYPDVISNTNIWQSTELVITYCEFRSNYRKDTAEVFPLSSPSWSKSSLCALKRTMSLLQEMTRYLPSGLNRMQDIGYFLFRSNNFMHSKLYMHPEEFAYI